MLISFNWLKEFIKIPAKIKATDLALALTKHTVEVERVIDQAQSFQGVVVGKVLEAKPHPNASRLKLLKVDVKTETLGIVCGAPNVAAGQMVPVALIGTVLPNGQEIKEVEIRGLKSQGMVCSEDELGLGGDKGGIMVLASSVKIGSSFAKYLKAEDFILEIDNKSLSNRPDLLSHYGLARELSVIFDFTLKDYDDFLSKSTFPAATRRDPEIKIVDSSSCSRYQALKIDNIKIEESPAWLKERLVAVGQRPINNVVDLSNYVMLETGQPLHVFDGDKVKSISVRSAKQGETMVTLDGQERVLTPEDLIIASDQGPLALAGIMGGEKSGVSLDTKNILIEAANFKAAAIRRSSQKFNLRSESSLRFEKSLDPALTEVALKRFLFLLQTISSDLKITSPILDYGDFKSSQLMIELDFSWLANKLGVDIPKSKVLKILERLGFSIENKKDDLIKLIVPSWRASKDVRYKEDVAEEVLRFYGYDDVPSQMPFENMNLPDLNKPRLLAREVKNFLAWKHSLVEVYNYSFLGEDQLSRLKIDFSKHLRLANPLSELYTLLRRNLAPGLIFNVKNNQAKAQNLGFFEIGSVFSDLPGDIDKGPQGETLPYQEQRLGLILAQEKNGSLELGKGILVDLIKHLFVYQKELKFLPADELPAWADANVSAKIILSGHEIGIIAELSREVCKNINLKKRAVVAELNFNLLAELATGSVDVRWQEAPKYPPVLRDLAVVVSDETLYNDLREEMINFNSLISSVELFDLYSGDKLPAGFKSLAFHVNFQAPDRTLTTAEADQIEKDLLNHLDKKFSAKLRNF